MKRWIKRLIVGTGVIAVLLLAFLVVERFRGQRALRQRLDELKSKGVVLNVRELQPKPVTADRNAFLDFAQLTNRTDSLLTNLTEAPPLLRFLKPGAAVVIWKSDNWTSAEETTNTWTQFGPKMEQASELVEFLRSATQKSDYDSGFNYENGFVDFQIGPLDKTKQVAQVLAAATLHQMRSHNLDAAHSNLCALVKSAALQSPEPLIICQLVRNACATLAFDVTWQALQERGWREPQLAALQAVWVESDFAGDMGRAMEMELAMTVDFYQQIGTSSSKLSHVIAEKETAFENSEELGLEGLIPPLPTHGFVLKYLHVPIWRFAWCAQDELRSLNRWQVVIAREQFARSNSWAALSSDVGARELFLLGSPSQDQGAMGCYDRARYLLSGDTFSVTDLVIRKALAAETLQQMAVTAIAIERCRAATGKLPSEIGELVPKYLPKLPRDSMDGKPLRYRLKSDTEFLLYSVGYDGVDDQGDPTASETKHPYRQIWDGKDAVWPAPTDTTETGL